MIMNSRCSLSSNEKKKVFLDVVSWHIFFYGTQIQNIKKLSMRRLGQRTASHANVNVPAAATGQPLM